MGATLDQDISSVTASIASQIILIASSGGHVDDYGVT